MHALILFLHDRVCFFRFISVQDRIRESRIKGLSNIGAVTRSVFLTMSVNPFMNTLQTIALKELTKFTGDPSQKVTQFINAIEQIGTFTELNDSMLHSLATIKLGGAAFNWYDNNKETLTSWSSLKTHLLERFKPSLSAVKTQLKERKQQSGETLLAYYDDVIDLCKQVDSEMPLHMIVDYLQDGLREELKIQVKCHMKTLNIELTPAIFLKIARTIEFDYEEH
jgi:hypothetical protein